MVTIVDAVPDRWDDLAEVLGGRGDPSKCWCQYYRAEDRWDFTDAGHNRDAMRRQVTTATVPHGVLAYEGDRPVGWCAAAPRRDYPRLGLIRAAQGTDDEVGLWSLTCFVVRVGHRRRGIGAALLAGAVDLAGRHGARTVEAYPMDPTVRRSSAADLFQGTVSMFLRAGFHEVTRPAPNRAIVRRSLTPG